MGVMKEINNDNLVKRMSDLKQYYSKENEELFYKEINQSELILAAYLLSETKLNIVRMVDDNGKEYIPAFTDWNSYYAFRDDRICKGIVFKLNDYMKLIDSDDSIEGIVINPHSHNFVLKRENLILRNSQFDIGVGERVSIGLPLKCPHRLEEVLTSFFDHNDSVECAYLLKMIKGNTDESYLLIVKDKVGFDKIQSDISECIKAVLKHNGILDCVSFDSEFAMKAIEGVTPFYKKV